jgi:ferrous iron transport protein B
MTANPLVALIGNPNAGKSALFNALTGARQKLGNYPGVTVERKSGRAALADGRPIELVDLPGTYSLTPTSPDEQVTRDVVLGKQAGERLPDALIIVADASNLENHLRFALEVLDLGLPTIIALNMVDLAARDGLELSPDALSAALGVPVVSTVAVRKRGLEHLLGALTLLVGEGAVALRPKPAPMSFTERRDWARKLARATIVSETPSRRLTHAVDKVALHPVIGPILLFALLFVMFQAVFSWSAAPTELIEGWFSTLSDIATGNTQPGYLRSFLVDGVINGVGSVVVFLPQIVILFFFILMLEASGYMTARRLPDGPADGAGRPVGPQLHPAAVELRLRHPRHHGDALHHRSQGPADDDPDRAADDLFGAAAGLCGDHRRVHPRDRVGGGSACRGWCCSRSMSSGSSARCSRRWCCAAR